MTQYKPPLQDLSFLLTHVFDIDDHAARAGIELDAETVMAIAEEAGKLAAGCIDPINRAGDTHGARMENGGVVTAPGFREAYAAYRDGQWSTLRFDADHGGQGLSAVIAAAVDEMWHGASISFALCPMLTNGAVEALTLAASDDVKKLFLSRLVSGEWTGTMNLTEPQAGSDLAAVKTRAVRQADGRYRIFGQKIFITYGDHDLTDNIVHLVLARVEGAPAGVKGLSLFAVPKRMVGADGSLLERNDLVCAALEHKLGIHGSPTAVMVFGETEGAVGYLVGEENRGLEYMFIMMNDARYSVGLQGLAISERAYQHAVAYARERVQGVPIGRGRESASPILHHPDVRRLLLAARSDIDAMRAFAMHVAMQKDLSHSQAASPQARKRAEERLGFMIPILKGWFTENAVRIASDALQVFGGMGYVEETGAAQYYRDARILTIYEGTTAIQANDLVGRKTLRDGGTVAMAVLEDIRQHANALQDLDQPAAVGLCGMLLQACTLQEEVLRWLKDNHEGNPAATHAGAVPYLMLWGMLCGGWMHALRLKGAASIGHSSRETDAVNMSASYYAKHVLPHAVALSSAIQFGAKPVTGFPDECW
ncbi:acyl-CoA dehydrogenase [Noviherbaspirillum galbum]|uniref:3-methylmercaptopropionyl-CoA dehydrogenase n=1 Tax=Noviherbaspirillum galbum TaxID=2709383 RepID=A0A6B3SZ58_9BURK|nr:acyl-CoA dehydrogenase [Noviherbaspirillum galbum]NEX63689.1 acyl-CoA dehydrogenase [Noviherbaspirillum galbum]